MAKKGGNTPKPASFEKLAKKYPGMSLGSEIKLQPQQELRIPTRSVAINHQLNGGLLYGKIIEIFGEESTGKTLFAMDLGYATQSLGGHIIWADAENTFNYTWFEKNGLDLSRIDVLSEQNAIEVISDFIQDAVVLRRSQLTANQPILVVIDSTAALDCLDNINSSQLDARAEMGNRAKAIYKFLRIRNAFFGKMGASLVLINQLRKKVGASKWEDPDTTPGGQASRFYASQRIGIVRGKQIKAKFKSGGEKKVGQNVYIKTKKDKTGPPRETTATQVYFTKTKDNPIGFHRYVGMPELLVELKVVERKKGSSRYYLDGKMIANGEDAFLKILSTDDDLRRKLIKKSGINTISKTQAQLEAIEKNLYPI